MDPNFRAELVDVPKVADWDYAREMISLLELFERKTTRASASSQVVVNLFYNDIIDIENHLKKMVASKDILTKLLGDKMKRKFDKYWKGDQKWNNLMYFGAILDPRLKTSVIVYGFGIKFEAEKTENETANDIKDKVTTAVKVVTEELEMLFRLYEMEYELENPKDLSKQSKNIDESFEGTEDSFIVFKSKSSSTPKVSRSELQKYLDENEEDHYKGYNILEWWKQSTSKYPILARMAKDILAIPISSVASEQAFSTGGRTIGTYRSSLSTPVVESLICTQDWIRRKRKKVNEELTDYDDIGKEICEMLEPGPKNN